MISRAQAVTVDQALQGKVPGAQITQNSGGPGGGGISVRLRGTNSFISGSDPLYIVDGVIVDNGSAQLADLGIRSNPQNRLADINPVGHRAHRGDSRRGRGGAVRVAREQRRRADLHEARHARQAAVHVDVARSRRASSASSSRSISIRTTRTGCRSRASTISTTSSTARAASEHNLTVEGGNDQTRYYISGNLLGRRRHHEVDVVAAERVRA